MFNWGVSYGEPMKLPTRWTLCLLAGAFLGVAQAQSEGISSPAERYKSIIDRNPFGLKPPPPPPVPVTNMAPVAPSNTAGVPMM